MIVILLSSLRLSYAQVNGKSKLALMQGVWENTVNSDTEKAFTIIKGKYSLNFVYDISGGSDFPLVETVKGFFNENTEVDSLSVDSLKEDGLHYIVINKEDVLLNGWVQSPCFLTPAYFACDGELMSINGGKLAEYSKSNSLLFEALVKLYKRGKLDQRDYIKDYLNIKARAIKSLKCKVYAEPRKLTMEQLNRDDVVVVLGEKGKWLKVKYKEDDFGWIRKADVVY